MEVSPGSWYVFIIFTNFAADAFFESTFLTERLIAQPALVELCPTHPLSEGRYVSDVMPTVPGL